MMREFASEAEAMAYVASRPRKLSDSAILRLVGMTDTRRARGGDRRSAAALAAEAPAKKAPSSAVTAERLGISAAKVEKARAVLSAADPSLRERVAAGELSLNRAAGLARTATRPESRAARAKLTKALHIAKDIRGVAANLRKLGEAFAEVAKDAETAARMVEEKAAEVKAEILKPEAAP